MAGVITDGDICFECVEESVEEIVQINDVIKGENGFAKYREYVRFYDSDDEDADLDAMSYKVWPIWDTSNDIEDGNNDDGETVSSKDTVSEVNAKEFKEINLDLINDGELIEVGCMAQDKLAFPDSQKLLSHPNFWVADTATSIHMTPHKQGVWNLRNVKHEITMGNKSTVVTAKVGDVFGQLCDRYGDVLANAKIGEVAITNQGFNLYSCTKMMKQGWTLGGDKNGIWLTKENKKISFDIPISTKDGVVFAAFIHLRDCSIRG